MESSFPAARRPTPGAVAPEGQASGGALACSRAAQRDPYLDARFATLAGGDAGGTGLYVLTRLANVAQLHRVDMPLGMRRQLTFGTEGIDAFLPSTDPRRPGGIVLAEEGGDENTQLFWLDSRGATPATSTSTPAGFAGGGAGFRPGGFGPHARAFSRPSGRETSRGAL